MTTHKSAKAKGKFLEDYVADQIVEKGIDKKARRDGASGAGTREKGDISTSMMIRGINAGIEVKNHKKLAIPDWWRQTKKLESLNREPVLAFKIPRTPLEETLCVVYLDTLLELIKNQNDFVDVIDFEADQNKARSIQYKTEDVRRAVKNLLRELE